MSMLHAQCVIMTPRLCQQLAEGVMKTLPVRGTKLALSRCQVFIANALPPWLLIWAECACLARGVVVACLFVECEVCAIVHTHIVHRTQAGGVMEWGVCVWGAPLYSCMRTLR